MFVLGIGGLGYKDSAAALLKDGEVVAAVAEERLSGVKHRAASPTGPCATAWRRPASRCRTAGT